MTSEVELPAPRFIDPSVAVETTVSASTALREHGFYRQIGKRVLDVALASLLLLIALPVALLAAALVRLTLGSPVLFRQDRVGKDGRTFTVLKLRTMRADRRRDPRGEPPRDVGDRRLTHKSGNDPRHTVIGQLLRRSSLDELPQLWNVLRGDMSMVGPRPELPHLVDRYEPWQHRRHEVRPGLTGSWQVTCRGVIAMQDATHLDVRYVEDLSLRGDLLLIARTPWALVRHAGR